MKTLVVALFLVASSTSAQVVDNVVEEAKTQIAAKMKDPESVKFTDLASVEIDGAFIVCGWVNAKNSYGGYVGYTPFVVTDTYADVRSKEPRSSFSSNHFKFDPIWANCTPNTDESFGSSLVEMEDLNAEKLCAGLAKRSKKEDKESRTRACVDREIDARTWLETHRTSATIASMCSTDARKYYSSGKVCVLENEANIVFSRGPKMVKPDQ